MCEKEVCTFQESLSALQGAGAEMLGISVDAPFSNAAFRDQTGAQYALLSDPARETIKAYDVVFPNFAEIEGYTVAKRSVFIIDEEGMPSSSMIKTDRLATVYPSISAKFGKTTSYALIVSRAGSESNAY